MTFILPKNEIWRQYSSIIKRLKTSLLSAARLAKIIFIYLVLKVFNY